MFIAFINLIFYFILLLFIICFIYLKDINKSYEREKETGQGGGTEGELGGGDYGEGDRFFHLLVYFPMTIMAKAVPG